MGLSLVDDAREGNKCKAENRSVRQERDLIRPSGTFSVNGEGKILRVVFNFSLLHEVEKVPEGRMRSFSTPKRKTPPLPAGFEFYIQ